MALDATDLSIRERIMAHLVARFCGRQEGEDEYTVTWNVVTRKPLAKTEVAQGNALGLYDVGESKTMQIGKTYSRLRLNIEFFHVVQLGDEPATHLNRMLTDIQRTMRSDIFCGGLCLQMEEVRNELDVEGPADRIVAGVIEYSIQYRHSVDDPRKF